MNRNVKDNRVSEDWTVIFLQSVLRFADAKPTTPCFRYRSNEGAGCGDEECCACHTVTAMNSAGLQIPD